MISAFENWRLRAKITKISCYFCEKKTAGSISGSPAVDWTGTRLPEASGEPPIVITTPQPGGTGVAGLGRGATGNWAREEIHGLKDPFRANNYGIISLTCYFVKRDGKGQAFGGAQARRSPPNACNNGETITTKSQE
jgi:hypothetical protein